jgi:hypothetical protein
MSEAEDEPQDCWIYEPEDHDEEYEYEAPLGDGHITMYRHVFRQGRLVDFNVSQCTRRGGKWCLVARADSRHSSVHMHVYDQAGNKVGEPEIVCGIETQADLENGYERADAMLETRWDDNYRRWLDVG